MPSFYTSVAHDLHLLHPPRLAAVELLAQLAGPPPARLVDVAAGSGDHAALLQHRGYQVFAIEVNAELCGVMRKHHPDLAGVIHGDMLEAFDLVRGPVALTYCIGSSLCELGSRSEVADVIGQLLDLCGPQGTVVLEVPNFEHLRAQRARLAEETAQVAPGDVRYGDLEDPEHAAGSPELGSMSAGETRLYLPQVSAYREDGSELRLEQHYAWQDDGSLLLRRSFSAPEGEVSDEQPLLELTREALAKCVPPDIEVEWLGDWHSALWSTACGQTIAILRESNLN